MNEGNPDWYGRLKGEPFRERTFTDEHMNRIESLAGRKGAAHAGSVPAARSKRRRLAWGGAAAFVFAASAVWGRVSSGRRENRERSIPPRADTRESR
ncbi:hypothetical protein [Cohnella algarum]|uniref:hypothetical protein n=1 Tax=Cohnella algarum TaxID=2044859 RepID=UPI001968825E|nr:hypothetical protein [Cohnella algarum]MBN2981398.1 hypothetical protein [Cohnella algarum]